MTVPDPDDAPLTASAGRASRARWRLGLDQLPTGAKLFLFLSVALLPLALFTIFAAYQTTRNAAEENRTRLRVLSAEASRTLMIELAGDLSALRATARAIAVDPEDGPSCARLRGIFAEAEAQGARFVVRDTAGEARCGAAVVEVPVPSGNAIATSRAPDGAIVFTVAGERGSSASASFPARFLADKAIPAGLPDRFGTSLRLPDGSSIELRDNGLGSFTSRDTLSTQLGIAGLALETELPKAPITMPVIATMLVPVLMWGAAAGLSWLLVDALILRTLRRLRRLVLGYTPGTILEPMAASPVSAQEIVDLEEAFRTLTYRLARHEQDLAEGLDRQTRLTREVHHRVKNNLQVIASLINFHSRGAKPEVIDAYASIQRRVDALAVVHRHHFAELEASNGLSLRAVISELSANIRATAPESAGNVGISLEVDTFLVSQDTAVAVAFLLTELIELAMTAGPGNMIRVSVRGIDGDPAHALVRLRSAALVENETITELMRTRYGRVVEGLARKVRSKLDYGPLDGVFEIVIPVNGRD